MLPRSISQSLCLRLRIPNEWPSSFLAKVTASALVSSIRSMPVSSLRWCFFGVCLFIYLFMLYVVNVRLFCFALLLWILLVFESVNRKRFSSCFVFWRWIFLLRSQICWFCVINVRLCLIFYEVMTFWLFYYGSVKAEPWFMFMFVYTIKFSCNTMKFF